MHRAHLTWMIPVLSLLVQGNVFWRQPVDMPGGWTRAYSAPVDIQGGSGHLDLYTAPGRLQSIHAYLKTLHGEHLAWMPGEVSAWALAVDGGEVVRYLVKPLPDGGFWISALRQSRSEAGTPGQDPTRHQIKEIPPFPQSSPTFYSRDGGNAAEVEISRTSATPRSVLEQMTSLMKGAGWQPSPANTGGFQMYIKRDRVALIAAKQTKDGFTRVLRLHKPLGVK